MANDSLRAKIMEILCDTEVFPVGYEGDSGKIAEEVQRHLPEEAGNWENFYHSVREALEIRAGEDAPRVRRVIEVEKRELQENNELKEINWYIFQ